VRPGSRTLDETAARSRRVGGLVTRNGQRLSRRRSRRAPLLRAYERVETLSSLLYATAPVPAPHRLLRAAPEIMRWRTSPAGVLVAGALLVPDKTAVRDGDRSVTFAELHRRTDAIAQQWRADGIDAGATLGLLLHNRVAFFEAMFAAHKLGCDIVFLNTSFAGPQVADVVATHGIDLLVHDRELLAEAQAADSARLVEDRELDAVVRTATKEPVPPPASPSRVVVLTSGTTGRPKGAARAGGDPLDAAGILACLPIITGDTAVVPVPLFHALGLFTASLSLSLRSTVVLDAEFDAERTLASVAEHRARLLVVVPTMLQRILALPDRTIDRYDLTSLRVVLTGGSALPGDLGVAWMDRFGDHLYNVYGSSEVGFATVAAPRDLRAAPGTAGRPAPGIVVRILDDDGREVPAGVTGRIFVGSGLRFDGYVGGGEDKAVVRGLLVTGDTGYIDRRGRLFIQGREDDMIISGGENLFPAEVEDLLLAHPDVVDVAVIGVPDDDFGQRLRAFVVGRPGASLSGDELRRYVRDRAARFKVPRDVIVLDVLPRSATGKLLRRQLMEHDAGTLGGARGEGDT
jgi:acyl-CoA synthetase (AMP-forming)/AMP-acid ligase II